MDPKQISSLAKLLRDNGDKVLNADFRLMLSGPLLRALNDSFSLIIDQNEICNPQTFQVVKPNYSKSDVFRDLQFVYDFVQKTQHLCITQFQNDEPFDGQIDISKFRSLRKLEIQKVSSQHIVGIEQMRAHLHEIVCIRSISCVQDIICHCGGDKSNGFIWNELKVADFSFNGLETIDTSLEFAPCLQNINLSHNKIVSVDAIKWLPNLKVLDLSFNCLTRVPTFHVEAARKLKLLNLTNNFIEDLSPLSRLNALSELDLSGNCLLDHGSLLPLSTLIALSFLNLKGNPLACHPKHRSAAVRYLHKNTASVKFILDFEPLTKQEKTLTGNYQSYYSILTSRLFTSSGSSGQTTPSRKTQENTPSSSVGSVKSFRFDSDEMATSTPGQRKVRVRRAIIADNESSVHVDAVMTKSVASLEGCKDHLETKKQIEDLRKQFGDDWLQSKGATMVESVIGIQTDRSGPTPQDTMEKLLQEEQIIEQQVQSTNNATIEPVVESNTYDNKPPTEDSVTEKTENEFTTGVDPSDTPFLTAESGDNIATTTTDENSTSNILTDIYKQSADEPEISDTEPNEATYLVYVQPKNDQMFLIISDVSIKEKDVLTGRTRTKWGIKTLVSCDRIRGDNLRINFDTVKRDKKERIYEVMEGLCPQVESLLRDILSKRPLSEMNQTLYRCANCTLHFSRENSFKKQHIDVFCPECKSKFVIELVEPKRAQSVEKSIVTPVQEAVKKADDLIKSGSHSSIGSAGSMNESSSCSKISRSESSLDSNQSVAGSTNTNRDRDSDFMKNGESDIEVLSNPSQSSIEVLDSRHSSRKHSEERRMLTSLEPIADVSVNNDMSPSDLLDAGSPKKKKSSKKHKTVLSGVHLTESSSSGSVTDSVCTAYEQTHNATTAERRNSDEKKDSSVISSMFSGLFNSTNLLMRSKVETSPSKYNFDQFNYSYTNFDDVDHRLKLFFYQSIFEDANEHFKWLVKGRIFDESQADANVNGFDGILMMSTTKYYVLQVIGPESETISKWLKRYMSCTIDRIENVGILPWKFGLTFSIKGVGDVHLVLQDILRTDSLLLYFTSNPLPDTCNIEYQISDCLQQKLLKLTDSVPVIMFAILSSCEISSDDSMHKWLAMVVTEKTLYLLTPSLKWLSKSAGVDLVALKIQPMSNLVQAEKQNSRLYDMNFMDDQKNECDLWKCAFETEASAESTLSAIGHSWEKLFGVPLD